MFGIVVVILGVLIGLRPREARAFALSGSSWPDGSVRIELQLQIDGPAKAVKWNDAAQSALKEWNGFLHGVKLAGVTASTAPRGVENGRNNVYWTTKVYGEDLGTAVAAFTLVWQSADDPEVTRESDVIFNPALTVGWDNYTGPVRADNTLDIRRVLMAEFGGLLGLDASNDVSLMSPMGPGNLEHPQPDDLAGIQYLYGPETAPWITVPPRSFTLGSDGGNVHTFTAEVRGRGPISYRWRRNGVDQTESDGAGFVQPGAPVVSSGWETEPGSYTIVVANRYGKTESKPATLKLTQGFTAVPGTKTVAQGGTVTFTGKYIGPGPYTYSWYGPGHDRIANVTQPKLTLRKVQPADAGDYALAVWNAKGEFVAQAYAQLRLDLSAEITPAAQGVDLGTPATLTAITLGEPRFQSPQGLVIDKAGRLCVADGGGLRCIASGGVVSTLSADAGGPCLALGPKGEIYHPDHMAERLMRWTATGPALLQAGQTSGGTNDGPVTKATFSNFGALAVAADGTIYAADFDDQVIRRISPRGYVTTFAGQVGVTTRTDGKGAKAAFEKLAGLTISPAGILYAIDQSRSYAVIRKITKDGTVTTLAGGQPAFPGNALQTDGKGKKAFFYSATAIGCDRSGNVYVADYTTIRKITSAGVVTTVAGDRTAWPGYADGKGKAARFSNFKFGLAVSAAGNIFVSEWDTGVIRRITPAGVVTTYAGKAGESAVVDGGPMTFQWAHQGKAIAGATKRSLTIPKAAAADAGDYTVTVKTVLGAATSSKARLEIKPCITQAPKLTPVMAGQSLTLQVAATSPTGHPLTYQWWKGDERIAGATGASLSFPALSVDDVGDYRVAISDGTYTTESTPLTVGPALALTAKPVGGTYRDGSVVTLSVSTYGVYAAGFGVPVALVRDAADNFYVADNGGGVIARLSPAGVITTVAGPGQPGGPGDGTGAAANFFGLRALARDASGRLVLVDRHAIRLVDPATRAVRTLAGDPNSYGYMNGAGATARFFNPAGVAVSPAGNFFVADTTNQMIRRVSPAGRVDVFAGQPRSGYVDGWSNTALFSYPTAVAIGQDNTVYVADANHVVGKIAPNLAVTTLAGDPGVIGHADGTGKGATFGRLADMAVDAHGNVFVLDEDAASIRRVSPQGVVTTVLPGDGGWISALCVTPKGDLAVIRSGRIEVWHLDPAGDLTAAVGDGPYCFDGEVYRTGALTRYQWLRDGVEIAGANSPTLTVTDNLQAGQEGTYTVRVSNAYGTLTSDAVVAREAAAPWSFTIDTTTRSLAPGDTATFSVAAAGTGAMTYQWLKDGVAIPGATAATYTLTSATTADGGYYAAAVTNTVGTSTSPAVAVNVGRSGDGLPAIAQAPWSNNVESGYPVTFSVTATGSGLSYQWARDGVAIAGATAATYEIPHALPADAADYTVRVTNAKGAVVSAVARLIIRPATLPVVSIDQTQSHSVEAGTALTLYGNAWASSGLLSYQWTRNGVAIEGATSYWLQIAPTRTTDAGRYTLVVTTDAGRVESASFTVQVTAAVPTITAPQTLVLQEDHASSPAKIGLADFDTPTTDLTLTAKSSDARLLPAAGLGLGGSGAKRTLVVKPAANRYGSCTVTLTVSDGRHRAKRTVNILVKSVNDAPTISAIANQTIAKNNATPALKFKIGDVETAASALRLTATSSNPALVPAAGLVLGGSGANRTVKVTPVANQAGSARITLKVSDGTASASTSFTVTVTSAARKTDIVMATPATPVIVTQPRSQVGKAGAAVTLTVVADGATGYRWIHDGADLKGSDSATLTLVPVQVTDAGGYAATATNAAGSVTSATAELTVVDASLAATRHGSILALTQTVTVAGASDGLTLSVPLPAGWTYVSGATAGAKTAPQAGDGSLLEWTWAPVPAKPLTFTYVLDVPVNQAIPDSLEGLVEVGTSDRSIRLLFEQSAK